MSPSRSAAFVLILACLVPAFSVCGERGAATSGRIAWLGNAERWGLLGFARESGPLAYRGAVSLESPTWSPPEVAPVARAWPGEGAIWVQFADGVVGRYSYASGRLARFARHAEAVLAVPVEGGAELIIAPAARSLDLVAGPERWRFELEGDLRWLERAADGRVLAVVDRAGQSEFLVLAPPADTVVGRISVPAVLEVAMVPWGDRVYYLSQDASDRVVRGLSLPGLEEIDQFELPEPGRALAVTPSGHRLYVGANRTLQVFDRIRGQRVREVQLPTTVSSLRFGPDGAYLLARSTDGEGVIVLQVGVDRVLGTIEAEWDEQLPVVVGGGRLAAAVGRELLLFDLPSLEELSRVDVDVPRLWVAVEWQPPRPRTELARLPADRAPATPGAQPGGDAARPVDADVSSATSPPPGYYAVVLAARERGGIAELVDWLRDRGYSAATDEHRDLSGVIWYRAMVGPYAQRAAVEEAVQSLSSRYGYKPWILSVEKGAG
ncbi:MAG: SPOR domain-containing protein [Gemmatimonadota bacterium]|nr:MAG: SPOR domain-containing protein [Gemmatimonadota bacterium]